MLTLLRCSRKTKTIKGADSAGDDHRPARRCRRWRKPLLKLTSLITSQLSGAVWRSPAFLRVRKKAHTHGTKINRSRRENGISGFCLLTGGEVFDCGKDFGPDWSADLSFSGKFPFIPLQGQEGRQGPCLQWRGERQPGLDRSPLITRHSHTLESKTA